MKLITDWTVDYQDGRRPKAVQVPHAWRQDLPVSEEGPALYQTIVEVPQAGGWLLFNGVSYAAVVSLNGTEVATHEGLWDGFSVSLSQFAGRTVTVEVKVTKNGGPTYPVQNVASGFLPYVFHTFGGIYDDVELHEGMSDPLNLPANSTPPRIAVDGTRLTYDGEPFYMRGLLHWGWYPELGHTAAPASLIEREILAAKKLGFNTVKFCLWVPPHRYLEMLEAHGMAAWLELPVWNPSPDEAIQRRMANELEAIVRQYRRHTNIVAWTVGCEIGSATPAAFRSRMTALVRSLTGCPLVRDDSGGSELEGMDPREFGTFYDYHPYCDLPFYPSVIDSLLPGARTAKPVLLGEFNDYDAHRDLAHLLEDHPFWASAIPEYNELGVRWQHDLPVVLRDSKFAHEPRASKHQELMAASTSKGEFMRRFAADAVRANESISGYVITGWRDTPISSSGLFDDWGQERYSAASILQWNGSASLFLIPLKRPTWHAGGNRPGYLDGANVWTGPTLWKLGVHSDRELHGGTFWRLLKGDEVVAEGALEPQSVEPLRPTEVGSIFVRLTEPGSYVLNVEFGPLHREWNIQVVAPRQIEGQLVVPDSARRASENQLGLTVLGFEEFDWKGADPAVVVLTDAGTLPAPFWRECAFEYADPEIWRTLQLENAWERLVPISADSVLDLAWIQARTGAPVSPLMTRLDTRSYEESVLLARIGERRFVTTLRPFGGLGCQPADLMHNPSGFQLVSDLLSAK